MKIEYKISNEELRQAIRDTHDMIRETMPRAERYKILQAHLEELLKIQLIRSRVCS